MYVRAVWFEGSPAELEARVARYPQQMQSIRGAPGCLGVAALAHRETGAGISVTYWEDQASMLATEARSEQVRAQATVPLGERDGEDVVAGEEAPDVVGPLGLAVDLGRAGGDLLVREDAHGIAQEQVLLGQAHGARGGRAGSHRAPC